MKSKLGMEANGRWSLACEQQIHQKLSQFIQQLVLGHSVASVRRVGIDPTSLLTAIAINKRDNIHSMNKAYS